LKPKKQVKYPKKDAVEFTMMHRSIRDPLYYDPDAPSKVFVPLQSMDELDDEKRKIVEAMPDADLGKLNDEEQKKEDLQIEEDHFYAAKKREELREADRIKKRAERKELEKQTGVKFKPYEYDSDENEFEARMDAKEAADEESEQEMEENTYDSEFEAEFFGKADPSINEQVFGQLE